MSQSIEEAVNDDIDTPLTTIESVCVQCFNKGTTRLLLMSIPFFKDVVVMSFECDHCGYKNNEIQTDNSREEYGEHIQLCVQNDRDMSRAIVKGTNATFSLPDLNFDVPPSTQTGVVSNIEGIISTALNGLSQFQLQRMEQDPQTGEKVQVVINRLKDVLAGTAYPFTVCIDDPAGNSYMESLSPPKDDAQMKRRRYTPTKDQLETMGFLEAQKAETCVNTSGEHKPETNNAAIICEDDPLLDLAQEAVDFEATCPHCNATGRNSMCEINVPGFQKCILMAFSCPSCGAKTNEIRPSGCIGEKGCTWELDVQTQEDLNRDVIKSDYCHISIPCLDFEMLPGSQGAFLTTVEGLITQIADHLDKAYPFTGDSSDKSVAEISNYRDTINKLRQLCTDPKVRPFKLILDDAADQSMIGAKTNLKSYEDNTIDKTLTHLLDPSINVQDNSLIRKFYQRTEEQDDDLGLKDMRVVNYDN